MACICAYNENNKTTKVIRHVFGNVLRISVPLTRRTVEITNGEASYVDEDFTPNLAYPFKVIMTSGPKNISYDAELHGTNVAYIEDKGKLPIGTYAVTITCNDDEGNPMRFKADFVLKVVDTTAEASVGGIGWYEGMDGESIYPVLRKNDPAIIVTDDAVTINAGATYQGDQDPTDDFADASAQTGDRHITIDDNYVTLNI